MRVIRLMAQAIDLLVALGVFLLGFLAVLPRLPAAAPPGVQAVVVLSFSILLVTGIQYLFLQNGQTVGKAFFGLRIVSAVPEQPLTVSMLVQREIFCKLMSCYMLCIPVLFGHRGGHEAATRTEVVRARGRARA